MKIRSIHIVNFRGLKRVDIAQFDAQSNLFVGVNGAGKSSILDAIAIILSYFTKRSQNNNMHGGAKISSEDISVNSKEGTTLAIKLDNNVEWQIYRTNSSQKTNSTNLQQLNQYVQYFRSEVEHNPSASIPVIAHYKVSRAVVVNSDNLKPSKRKTHNSIFDIYNDALDGKASFGPFFTWYREQEDIENEKIRDDRNYRDSGLEAIRTAMKSVFPEYSEMRVQRSPRALVLRKGETLFKLNQLSDGEKCYITLVCDLASRLAIANPAQNPLEGSGIVLIDEVDLHLHPQWQLSVITKLTQTFPNCQFIFTTHSPIVASDTRGNVYGLEQGELIPFKTFGRTSNTILAEVFDVPNPRNQYIQSLIDETYNAIHSGNSDVFNEKMAELVNNNVDTEDIVRIKLEKARWDQRIHEAH